MLLGMRCMKALSRCPVRAYCSSFPYGISDFAMIRREGAFYVDKTHFIPKLEESPIQLLFVRPPRFGKTLLLSMIRNYYDIAMADQFKSIFNGLYIMEHPTSLRSSFNILYINLAIATEGDLNYNFNKAINKNICDCCSRYGIDSSKILENQNAFMSLRRLGRQFSGKNFMVLIDEYDRVANELMFVKPEAYDDDDCEWSPLRSILTCLKTLPEVVGFSKYRSVIMGVTPLVLASTCGYNVARNISRDVNFCDMVGITESDISHALKRYFKLTPDQETHVLCLMRNYYDGFIFPGCKENLYNPTLVIGFLKRMLHAGEFKDSILNTSVESIEPSLMSDCKVQVSDRVLNAISRVPSASDIVYRLANKHLETTVTRIEGLLTLRDVMHPLPGDPDAHDRALSLLYYHGVVTLKNNSKLGKPVSLQLPNKLEEIYFRDHLCKTLLIPEKLLYDLLYNPCESTLKLLLTKIIKRQQSLFDNRFSEGDLRYMLEASLKALIGSSSLQAKVILGAGRSDLLLTLPHSTVIIEIRRIRLNALLPSEALTGVWPKNLPKTVNWSEHKLREMIDFLKCQSEEELLNCKVCMEQQGNYGNVNEVLIAGKQQVKASGMKHPPGTCRTFVVMQVGFPIIVREF